jgi:hypothetical protein
MVSHIGRQIAALDPFGHHVAKTFFGAPHVVHRHDMRMVQAGKHTRLRQICGHVLRRFDPAAMGHLDGYFALQLFITREQHAAEGTLS